MTAGDHLSYQPYFDELVRWASSEARKPDLIAARADYRALVGELFEDDKQFDARMAAFLDFYLFDRQAPGGKVPSQELYEQMLGTEPPERANAFRALCRTLHGLFQVRKLGADRVWLKDLFLGDEYEVSERRSLVGLEKGDVLEARLVPWAGHWLFSPAFCCHPKAAVPSILAEVRRRRKQSPDQLDRSFIYDCARRALKADRYRQIAIEKIYGFASSAG